ncbi:endolytic transglycosylase MltG [Mesorhizobium sp. M1C.F.Ca.ET.193.01.1.1]|uniref:endolytic transglycosylase MltG n=1 Tax=unclassified Mesorhizobium TaxID=325217 RepID=UPI000FD36C4D|nr:MULTISPECIES: endolytic transglycosylase MltG [unclassified Mesorhizobium]TGS95665.1 endolytic transglycosylase MltG [bacterium M00.F.Ca.ET.177.01.1.1]TGQ51737.1 endolytic transglycosylase MltG [Mesorhizobium sp. M1C.F.Ca.ET.210.01.1.1]TGQ67971.1 endolytic transglycosylase MltG [Mesorhizobium sp. M1C.F.Ca.ET.212.01.1.1]TGR03056.1 endolytic transglycosylase MltG [Mesorhizobium sp. M1C.F.Ca.ET.204.01.1.1]TGR23595.1 endolytic transglycosylase MltG [Mesorhizobium sp. M1C.F.Ca.ET.196.01.1.1]
MNTNPGGGEFGQRQTQGPIVPKTAAEALRPEAGTPPPSKRSRASRSQVVVFLNFFLSVVILIVLASGAALYFGMQAFVEPGPSANGDTFMVKPSTGVQEIADQLERRGLISDARIFRLGVRATGNDSALKAGEYAIKPRASMRDIMELLKSGKSVMYSLTIPEGLTVEQALERVADQEALTGDMPASMPPEGSIATDTLRFTRGATRQQMIDKLVADQKKLIEDVWAHRAPDLPVANMEDFVILASIVEKETGRGDERSRVAAVFLNRLAKGMRLQSDPTIIYGLFGGKGKPADRPIYQSDIDKQTPYNTYLIKGLPPTPIANPGRAALEAVANPSKTDDLYFVADGTGGHVFAATLEEHNQNVARYRALQKKQADDAAKASGQTTAPAAPDDSTGSGDSGENGDAGGDAAQ